MIVILTRYLLLRKFHQTPRTYPRYHKSNYEKDSLHKQLVKGPGRFQGYVGNFLDYYDYCTCSILVLLLLRCLIQCMTVAMLPSLRLKAYIVHLRMYLVILVLVPSNCYVGSLHFRRAMIAMNRAELSWKVSQNSKVFKMRSGKLFRVSLPSRPSCPSSVFFCWGKKSQRRIFQIGHRKKPFFCAFQSKAPCWPVLLL